MRRKELTGGIEKALFKNGAVQAVVECNDVRGEQGGLNKYQS